VKDDTYKEWSIVSFYCLADIDGQSYKSADCSFFATASVDDVMSNPAINTAVAADLGHDETGMTE
jgi:hypothetical protein